jgi:hypothetical protein
LDFAGLRMERGPFQGIWRILPSTEAVSPKVRRAGISAAQRPSFGILRNFSSQGE